LVAIERPQMSKVVLAVMMLLGAAVGGAGPISAQEGPGGAINPSRDCQTLLSCNFKKGGRWRGCVSSYSCRTCRFVSAPCAIVGAKGRVCQELRCVWGGA
jgi:hypothetical protein